MMMRGPKLIPKILDKIREYMQRKNLSMFDGIRGITLQYLPKKLYMDVVQY